MSLVRLTLRRPLTVIAAVLAVGLGAVLALGRMTRDVFPPLDVPTIYVAQPYGGMDPAQMEGSFTYFYEYHFLYITGIEHVESKSIQGASLMKLQFHPGTDMSQAMSETVAYVNRARAFMPPGTVPPFIMRFDAGSVPVGYLVFSTDNPARTLGQMQDAALNIVRPMFATLPGVSAPPPFGGSARTIVVNADPQKLRAYDLSPQDLLTAVTHANVISPSGNINLEGAYPFVPVNAVPKDIRELGAVTLRSSAAGAVFLRDVATVEDGSDVVTSYALANGRRTVYIPVTKRADASTLSVVSLVKENLARFQSALPDDVKVSYEFDQSPVVTRAIDDLAREGLLGAVLAGLMVLAFLRNWRTAMVVVLNIPLSLLASTFALWASGQNINLMTLGGLALAVGILVDEATVTVENIHAHVDGGAPIARAALEATQETMLPRFLAMACIVAVFLPAFLMVGAARALFVPMALAVGYSMVASYLLSSTLVPVLSIWLLRKAGSGHREQADSGFGRFRRHYGSALSRIVNARAAVVIVYLLASIAVVGWLGSRMGSEIFPRVDAGQLAIRFRAPSGTTVETTEAIAKNILDIVAREVGAENVELSIGLVGVHAANYPVNLIHLWNSGPEEGWLALQLKRGSTGSDESIREKLREVFGRELPSVRFSFEPSDIVNRVMSFGASTPIEIAVSGPSLAVDKEFADRIYSRISGLPHLRDVQFSQTLDFPTVQVNVDRERAGLLGIRMDDVTRSLVSATTSSRFTVANFWSDPNSGVSYNLQVQIPQSRMSSVEDLKNVPVGTAAGEPVLLRSLANVDSGSAVGTYERYNMARVVSLTANLHDTDLGTVSSEIAEILDEVGAPPPKTSVAVRGQTVPLAQLTGAFEAGLAGAVVVILLILTASFQSFVLGFTVLSTLPAVLAGILVMLAATGTTLNIQSATGAIMAMGVAVANAILLVTFAERSRNESGDAAAAAIEGATARLRPILMTSFAMIAGMLPMAVGAGEGGQQTAPLGRAVLGGLLFATVATLLILPAVFALVRGRARTGSVSLDPDDPLSAYHVQAGN